MTRAAPANDLADVLSRPTGTRLLLPKLIVRQVSVREIRYDGVEQTVWDYRFQVIGERRDYLIEYSGRHHFKWNSGYELWLVATIHRHSQRWRCTRVKRPVEETPATVPLFGRDW